MSGPSELLPDGGDMAERLVLRELSHELGDELASVIKLVSVAASRCDSPEARASLASVRDRLRGHAQVHRSLQMMEYTTTIDLAAYLHHLCRSISRSRLERDGIALSLLLDPVRMSSERCRLLGMIVFELLADSARHVPHGGAGAIHLEMWPTDTSIACCVTDNGSSDEGAHLERGSAVVEALAASVRGTVDIRRGLDGTRVVVNIPRGADEMPVAGE
ncbi:hypothetical protein AXW67_37025 [Bradyrhizobium neotropicale]|uniref:histidine kinase n=2 Tax=Bradyrhizobium neotropicale TaxID=1497615 RepID=A0A176ZGP1_9BRAD|nr:hypothetical protein AXW67_37025 [Bradyrhizobium neotropicale]